MCAYFPVINDHIAKRNKKVGHPQHPFTQCLLTITLTQMLDYDSARNKHRKMIEKPSEDPSKLPKVRSFS
jgi:hypothetical protein